MAKDVLLIDDFRVLQATRTARTFDEGIQALKDLTPDLLKLDHDLGDTDPKKTGYGIVLFLEHEIGIRPKEIEIVSSNPVGLMAIRAGIESIGYKLDFLTSRWYWPNKPTPSDG